MVLELLNEDNPPQTADDALEEAYRIRLAALGRSNIETLATLRYLARLRGLPSRTHGDRARIEAVAGMFREIIARSTNDQRLGRESAPSVHVAFARMYARNGLAEEARRELRIALEQTRGWDWDNRCSLIAAPHRGQG